MIELNAGFMPLTDSAILLIAKEQGFAEAEGIALNLVRESSWANVRDRLSIGQFDVAHTLAPMAVAANLGLTPFNTELIAPMALGLGGNAITVSKAVFLAMAEALPFALNDAGKAGKALKAVVDRRKNQGLGPLQFAVVHPHSVHNYELRYWLAASDILPDRDVEIIVLPPQLMSDTMAMNHIDGFCVGEPWNTVAVERGIGKIATVKAAIWPSSPEKVLALRASWATNNAEALQGLLRALYASAQWCSDKQNTQALADILALPEYLNLHPDLIKPCLTGDVLKGHALDNGLRFFESFAQAATFPWQSHALWLYTQMVRWGHIAHKPENIQIALESFRPDIYRECLAPMGAVVPAANSKVEGGLSTMTAVGVSTQSLFLGPDGFFDGMVFDPDTVEAYIKAQC